MNPLSSPPAPIRPLGERLSTLRETFEQQFWAAHPNLRRCARVADASIDRPILEALQRGTREPADALHTKPNAEELRQSILHLAIRMIDKKGALALLDRLAFLLLPDAPGYAQYRVDVKLCGDCGISGKLFFDRITTPRLAPEFPGDVQVEYEVLGFMANGRDILPELRDAGLIDFLEELARTHAEGQA